MNILSALQRLQAAGRRWLQPRGLRSAAGAGLAATLLAAPLAHAEFQNGSFESDFAGWTVDALRVANRIPTFPPTKFEDLDTRAWDNTTDGSPPGTSVVVGATVAPHTNNVLRTPLFGDKSARVGDGVSDYRGASIRQIATMKVEDVDPADGKVHVRFAVAPVLEAPNHPADQQPYFFVEVKNRTKGTQLFHTFNFANQTGVAWQSVGSYQFTSWQAVDIAPGQGVLDIGDDVEVIIVSGGCGQGGHGALVYADSGQGLTTLPGPFVSATGPQYAVPSDASPVTQRTVTYNYHYSNGGDAPMPGSQVIIRSPQDQDVRSSGGTQTTPQQNLRVDKSALPNGCTVAEQPGPHADKSLGSIDIVTCEVGTLNPGNVGDLQLKWIVPSDARGPTLNHGNYYIQSASSQPLLGPLVKTNLTNLRLADLKATVINAASSLSCGASTAYTVTLENNGPDEAPAGVVIDNAVPAGLTPGNWTCSATGSTLACPAASGTGSISATTTTAWAAGDKLVYTVNATVDACASGARLITYPVSLALPSTDNTTVDPDASNNTGAQTLNAGAALQTLNVSATGSGQGKVTSVLPGIVCDKTGASCADSKQFPQGSQVALYANAPSGSIFSGWTGGVCSGTAQPCLVTMTQARSVTATFSTPVDVGITVGAGGTATPGTGTTVPVAPGATTAITVVPSSGYAPVFGGSCPAGSYVGNTYTTGAVNASCTVDITFTNAAGVVTATPNAPSNGSVIGGAKTVQPGGSATWKLVANSGYAPGPVTGSCPAGTWNADRTEYTVAAVAADCNVDFSFSATHTVTASVSPASAGPGTITMGSTQSVTGGGAAVFTLSRPGTVDPASTCPAGSFDVAGTTYTVPNVTANCAVVFSFAALPPAPVAPASIPTLSQWGLAILSALMGLFMVGMHRRRMR